tara:strand:+ start:620 stop:3079 length:2460 start_codon:yes stop_codon:yes gene_type:complete
MALVLKDRVKETTTTTGTGTYTLAGAENGFEAFSSIGNSNTTYYCCTDGVDFEVGIGTYTLSGTTLARTTILQSSNSDAAVNWTDGTRIIFCTQPAEKAVFLDSSGNMPITNNATIGGTLGVTGVLTGTSLDISGDVDIDGTLEADAVTVNGTALNTVIAGVTVTNATNSAHVSVADNESTNEENLITFIEDASATGNVGLESDGDFSYNPSTGTVSATVFKGNIDAVDGDFDGTLEADAITVGGVALNTVVAGVTVTNATNSSHVLVTDNESTSEENLITFVEDATSTTGNVGLEMDGNLSYNPSSGTVTATVFKGNIDAVDGDFDGTLEADAITIGGTAVGSIFSPIAGGTGILTTGALDTGSITSGFGTINNGASAITTTGVGSFGSLDISGDIDVDGTTNLDVVDIDGAVDMASTATITGNLTLGAQLIMPDVTSTKILVADGTSFQEVAVSGDITIANTGAVTIANTAVETAMIAADAITGAKIADDAINSEHYTDGSIDTAHIADAQVTLAKIANQAANTVLVRDANSSGVVSAKAVTNTQILIGDGTGFTAAALSGDVTMTNGGAVTIAAQAVENSMLADDAVGADELAANAVVEASIVDNAVTLAKMAGIARGKLIIGDASGNPSVIGPGNANQVLTSDGTDIAFADAAGASSLAADNLTAGDAAVVLSTTSGTITIDNAANDADIIFKGTDGGADITALTLDMSAAGAATFNNDITAFSDKRLKTDIKPITNGLNKVMQMQGVYYKRNDVENAKEQVGVLAQDMEQILPEVVLTADDDIQTKSVDYGKICSVLIEAIKELKDEIEELKAK